MKKNLMLLAGTLFTVLIVITSTKSVYADNASDEYYEKALIQLEEANAEYELQQAVVESATASYEAIKNSDDLLAKQKAYDFMTNAYNQLRWRLDEVNNAKANLEAAKSRNALAAKNEDDIVTTQSEMMGDAVKAINGYKNQLDVSPSLSSAIDDLSEDLSRQKAQAMALLSMKYEYQDPHDEFVNFTYDSGITVSMLNPSLLDEQDSVLYAKWKLEDKSSLTDAEIDEINAFVNTICNGYKSYRNGNSLGEYYEAIYKSVDDRYKTYYSRWIKYKLGNNDVEKKVLDMFLKTYYERVDAMYAHLMNKELGPKAKMQVVMMEGYQDDMLKDGHTDSFIEKTLNASFGQGVDQVINDFDAGIDLDEELKEMKNILLDKQ